MATITYAHPASYYVGPLVNPVVKPPTKNDPVAIEYTEKEAAYRTYLIQRLRRAQENRDTKHGELGGKTYLQKFEENEKIANTVLEQPKDQSEEKMSTGSIEAKLHTLLSHIDNLNLTPQVNAFDRNNQVLRELGVAFTDIMFVTAQHDGNDDGGDKEKKILRQLELLKQGTVFVQENWVSIFEKKKTLKGKYKGEFKRFEGYIQRLEKVFEGCAREILYSPSVYLGDITKFSMNDQPYVFTVEQMHYDMAATLYGRFENWQYVRPGVPDAMTTDSAAVGGRTSFEPKFRLTNLKDDQVEIVKYQDQPNDEFMIMINGVLMLPPGFPLSAMTAAGKYNITKQTLYVYNAQYAYGKSFVSSGAIYELSKIIDRMIALFVMKTRKSITPPYINTTNRVIPARVLNPGNITMGLPSNALSPIGTESQGVTSSEFQIFKELQDEVERSTISAVFQGQQAKSGATATEIIEVQRQAKLTLGLIISACTLLEVKLGYLRLYNIISNWLQPIGSHPDGSARYRNVTRELAIEGAGKGERRVIPIDGSLPKPEVVRMLSLKDERAKGYPVRRMYLSPKTVRESQITWYITVEPREDQTSAYYKVLFREMIGDLLTIMQLGAQPNVDGITDEFAKIYNVDKAQMFSGDPAMSPMEGAADPATIAGNRAAGNMNRSGVPKSGGGQPQPKPRSGS